MGWRKTCVRGSDWVSPFVGLSSRGFYSGSSCLESRLMQSDKTRESENQLVFIPFAFDTFSFLAPEAVELLNRVRRVMNSNVMTPRSTNVVFHRISFAIQKGLAAQLIARLPCTTIKHCQCASLCLTSLQSRLTRMFVQDQMGEI